MVGATRSRVSHFMNKFRTLGFVDYDESCKSTVPFSTLFSTTRSGTPSEVEVGEPSE
jgi:hypothetical protein